MMVILIAHCQIEKFEKPETDSYDRYAPRLHKHASAVVREWCDEVLFATYKVHTKQVDEGFGQKKAEGIGSGERIVRSTERPAHVAKNRLNPPDESPLDYCVYAQYLPSLKSPALHSSRPSQPKLLRRSRHGDGALRQASLRKINGGKKDG